MSSMHRHWAGKLPAYDAEKTLSEVQFASEEASACPQARTGEPETIRRQSVCIPPVSWWLRQVAAL